MAAAFTCALCILSLSLRSHPKLSELSIVVTRGEYLEIMAQGGVGGQAAMEEAGGSSLPRLWRRVLASLEQLVKVIFEANKITVSKIRALAFKQGCRPMDL